MELIDQDFNLLDKIFRHNKYHSFSNFISSLKCHELTESECIDKIRNNKFTYSEVSNIIQNIFNVLFENEFNATEENLFLNKYLGTDTDNFSSELLFLAIYYAITPIRKSKISKNLQKNALMFINLFMQIYYSPETDCYLDGAYDNIFKQFTEFFDLASNRIYKKTYTSVYLSQ